MKKTLRCLTLSLLILTFCAIVSVAQKPKPAPDYKISALKLMPFNEQTGLFEAEIGPKDERSFFNDLAISMLVTVEISGEAGTFETGRKVEVTVMEGKKIKVKKLEQVGLIGDGGKYFFPVWLPSAMCSQITVTARLVGQKTVSKMSQKVPFQCGE